MDDPQGKVVKVVNLTTKSELFGFANPKYSDLSKNTSAVRLTGVLSYVWGRNSKTEALLRFHWVTVNGLSGSGGG